MIIFSSLIGERSNKPNELKVNLDRLIAAGKRIKKYRMVIPKDRLLALDCHNDIPAKKIRKRIIIGPIFTTDFAFPLQAKMSNETRSKLMNKNCFIKLSPCYEKQPF